MPLDVTTDVKDEKLSKDDILADLNLDDSSDDKDDLLKESKGEKKDDDEKEEELEEEEPKEEDLALTSYPRRKEILAKYPNFFKEFPTLNNAFYRERAYTELLPTIEDAKEVIARASDFDKFEEKLLSGDNESVLQAVKDADPNAFAKIVDNYLPNLQKVDQQAYYHIIGNTTKNIIVAMAREAATTKNEQLQSAALILNQFMFGNSNFTAPQNLAKEEPAKEVNDERAKFFQERFESVRDDLSTKADNILKSTITANIDPKEAMSDYVRRNAVKDCLEAVNESLESDTRFRASLDKLWEQAFEDNLSQKSLDKIKSAYLNQAKVILPNLISKTRREALGGLAKTSGKVKDNGEDDDLEVRAKKPGSSSSSSNRTNESEKGKIPRGMKTLDYLNS